MLVVAHKSLFLITIVTIYSELSIKNYIMRVTIVNFIIINFAATLIFYL